MDRFDGLMVIGGLAVAIGIGLFDYRVGLIAVGVLCLALAVLGARGASHVSHGNVAASGEVSHAKPQRGKEGSGFPPARE